MRTTVIGRIGVGLAFGVGALSLAPAANSQTTAKSAAGNQTTTSQPHPTRVRVKMDGFELAPQSTHGGPDIGPLPDEEFRPGGAYRLSKP